MAIQLRDRLPDAASERRDRRLASEIGRHARLELAFGCRNGRTVVTHAYAEPPFQVGRGFDIDGALYLIIVCSGPGIFAGDHLRQAISVERGARVVLVSQSALQVHPSDAEEPARLHHTYVIDDDGELQCHWDPLIPFADARVAERFDLQLSSGSRLYWSDALMSGRCGRGEAWRFRELVHELRLTVGRTLQYLERYRIAPDERRVDRPWIAADHHYLGTSLAHHDATTAEVAERVHRRLAAIDGVQAGVDLVTPHLLVGRLLSEGGPAFGRARGMFREMVLDAVFGNRFVARR